MTLGFQPNAFQNQEVYDHKGFQVVVTPTPVAAITVDQTIQMGSDQWELALLSSKPWRARTNIDTADISFGLIDALGDPNLIKQVTEGRIDEWELQIDPNKLVGRIRGRDAMALAGETSLFLTYVSGGVLPPVTPPENLPPELRPIPGITTKLLLPGTWTASAICSDLASRVGLICSYQAPDYQLHTDVDVSGSAFSAIQQVIAPFCSFEPFKIDVWVEGKTLMIRQRQGLVESPGLLGPLPGVLNTITVADARITTFLIRSHWLDAVRIFRYTGAIIGPCANPNDTEFIFETLEDETAATIQGPATNTRTNIQKTRRKSDKAELRSSKEVWDLQNHGLASRESVEHFWDAIKIDANCKIINSPLERGSSTVIESVDPVSGIFQHTQTVTVSMIYDREDFLALQVTQTSDLIDRKFVITKKEIKRLFDNGTKNYTDETSTYTAGSEGRLSLESKHVAPGSGHRPGGGGRAPKETSLGTTRAVMAQVIDDVPGAKDFTVSNDSMDQGAIAVIFNQAKASSLAQEYEVQFTAVNIPWLKKGMMLKINGLTYEDGVTPFDLPNMLVLDSRVVFTEDSEHPSALTQVKCIFWSKHYGEA